MSLWNKSGKVPTHLTAAEKRNVIATKAGWTRRLVYTDVNGNNRVKDITLVALGNLDKEVTMGNPDITQIYVANSTGGTSLKKNQLNHVYVVFTEALSIAASPSPFRLTIANTAGGNNVVATSNTNKASIVNANNTLDFRFKVATAGTYKIQAQNLSNTAATKVYSVSGTGITETVNNNISAVVSNTNGTFTIS
jgi:hypothetical protein